MSDQVISLNLELKIQAKWRLQRDIDRQAESFQRGATAESFSLDGLDLRNRGPQIPGPAPTLVHDPYPRGLSTIFVGRYDDAATAGGNVKLPRDDRGEASVRQAWRQAIHGCDNQPHLLVVAPQFPIIVVTPPAPVNPRVDERIRLLNQPPREENHRLLRSGLKLRSGAFEDEGSVSIVASTNRHSQGYKSGERMEFEVE
ncbi:hypothetical protein DV736_g5888, partial [Chaetothyriales sp. CBS 134916]